MAAIRLDQARTGADGAVAGTPEAQVIPRPNHGGAVRTHMTAAAIRR